MKMPTGRIRLQEIGRGAIAWGGYITPRKNTIWVIWIEQYGRRITPYHDPFTEHDYDETDELPLDLRLQPILYEAGWTCLGA